MPPRSKSIVLGVTSSTSLILLEGFPEYLAEQGWDVHVVASGLPPASSPSLQFHDIDMHRDPRPISDLKSLYKWFWLLQRLKPAVISAGTPKAGLLAMIAAKLTGVPRRVYHLRGLRLETEVGFRYRLLRILEAVAAGCSTDVLAVSPSLRKKAVEVGIVPGNKVRVLGDGSSNGVDVFRFRPSKMPAEAVRQLSGDIGLEPGIPVVGYVGRLTRDKGLETLLQASLELGQRGCKHQVLVVGELEPGFRAKWGHVRTAEARSPVVTGFVEDTSPYYQLMDVLCLPTKREGFPNVVLEASASGVPVVTTRVTGAVDSVVGGETGVLVEPDSGEKLAEALETVLFGTTTAMGQAGRKHVVERFNQGDVWRRTCEYYSMPDPLFEEIVAVRSSEGPANGRFS